MVREGLRGEGYGEMDWESLFEMVPQGHGFWGAIEDRIKYLTHRLSYAEEKQYRSGLQQRREALQTLLANKEKLSQDMPDDGCLLPLIAKYAAYAHMDKPSDKILNHLFDEVRRSAGRYPCPDIIQDKEDEIRCKLQKNPPTNRLDKIVAIEEYLSLIHDTQGTVATHGCIVTNEAVALANIVLNMLAED